MLAKLLRSKLVFIALIIGAGWYAYQYPEQVPITSVQSYLTDFKKSGQADEIIDSASGSVMGISTQVREYVQDVQNNNQTNQNPKTVDLGASTNQLIGKIESLPNNQLMQLKTQLCQDVIDQALATISGVQK